MNDPFEGRVSAGGSTLDIASSRCSDVSLNIEVGEEGRINVCAWCSASAEVHGVWAVQTLAVGLGLDMSGVLRAVSVWSDDNIRSTYHVPVETGVGANIVCVDVTEVY